MHFETKAIHTGLDSPDNTGSVVPAIYPSTIFEIDADGRKKGDFHYTRLDNPNRRQLEHLISTLEEGEGALAFSSGVAAASAVMQSLQPGDHILVPEDIYAGNRMLIQNILIPWGLEVDFIRMDQTSRIEQALRDNTRLIWIETPSNPLMRISDISAICKLASDRGILTCVDNTWPTPVNQLPLKLGADLVVHSTTKYFGGHSDLLGGAVAARKKDDFFERVRTVQWTGGAVPSPADCWMLCRSTRTLPYRMRGHNEHAMILARFLKDQARVSEVYYPGLDSHPGHATARKQMSGFGGMISFLIDGNAGDAIKIVGRSELIKRATSLGGVESTWEHRRSSEGENSVTPENMIRISVGLEHPEDLIEDLAKALR